MAAAPRGERIAVIDLGPAAPDARPQLTAALVAAGFEPLSDGAVQDALAGRDVDGDAVALAAALATAQRAFGELACNAVTSAAQQAMGLAAARQAAGRPVPELSRALTYLLLCADRESRIDAAQLAAHRLRALGGSPDVPASVWAKYPAVDTVGNAELVELDIAADVPGAEIWIDFARAGVSPLHVSIAAGDHVIAGAAGSKRGWAAGTAVRKQKSLQLALAEPAGTWSEVAHRVAGWQGAAPPPRELAWLFAQIDVRIALVRRGDVVEAWGQVGRSELPHRIGAPAPLSALDPVMRSIADRIARWSDHAPDPDVPLLTEDRRADSADKPTRWWVYAAIAGAAAIGATIILVHDTGSDRQRVELHYP